ncbi:hypothetical protein M514_13090 [Trichuris suis]|uniref:Tudor domain-containing protein n=1 Tax=Trichuris suis TaxID=68888 RepID=A0A085NQN6_9BILA|nr:hypothetical protein M513_13090 [Trichuris suis]KFD71782.1 hypothetical protein M514_13090 [Trichuris suis]
MNGISRLSISQSSSAGHRADESSDHVLPDIEFNMADVTLSEYVMRTNLFASRMLQWGPNRGFLERIFAFYSSHRRRQLLLLRKELMFKGQLVIVETSPRRNPLRCLVESTPDEEGNVSLVSIDLRKKVDDRNNIYFLIREFATHLPPWVVEVNPVPAIVWPDRYSLPCVRRNPVEWEIATEQFRRFRKGPRVPEGSSIGTMIKITKVVEPHMFLGKPVLWLRQCSRLREILGSFYDVYKDQLRLNAELLKVGLPVAFNAYDEWHRGEVLSLPGSLGLMKILYLDEGWEDEIRCDKVYHLVNSFTKHGIGLLRMKLAGILPPRRGWPKKAYDYVNEDCVNKELFFLMTHQVCDVYEGYLSHGDDVKTSLRSMNANWVGDNLERNFRAISLAGRPFEESEEDE